MSDPVALIIVTSSARLGRELVPKSSLRFAQPILLRSLHGLQKKLQLHSAAFVLIEWNATDGEPLRTLDDLRRNFSSFRFAVFCPDLSERTVTDAETIRFMFLESGATAVFAHRRELTNLLTILRKHSADHPEPVKDRIREIHEFLPWPE